MAINGEIRVAFEDVFPFGAWLVSEVEPAKDYDRSTDAEFKQAVERDERGNELLVGGEPLRHWTVTVLDGDKSVRQDRTIKVTVLSTVQPVPPENTDGAPFVSVAFEGLMLRRYVQRAKCTPPRAGRQHRCGAAEVTILRATGMVSPKQLVATASNGNGRADA